MKKLETWLVTLLLLVAPVSHAAIVVSANNDSTGPVTVNVGDSVSIEVVADNCESVSGNNAAWRDNWENAGNPQQEIYATSPCTVTSLNRTTSFGSPGTYTVRFISEFCKNYRSSGECRGGGWEEDQRGSIVINVVDPNALTCFEDDYAGSSLNPDDWVASVASGSFTPSVVNGRLRMTEASANQSTALTLQREIPGADNLVVLEFDYYAYGGNGADGIAVVLSDALVTPRPGSFGGSLGYAQRNNGDPGFAGGWLGIGLDEYGNFSNPSEGRQGGPGRIRQSVAIRGSGSGSTGYNYLEGTGTLPTGVDATGSSSPHRYRITVDSRTAGQAIVSVERDTGSGFNTLIPAFNVLNNSSQANVPENFLLSLTGSTGGSTNIHELDDLELCALKLNPIGEQVDHFEIVHDGVALTCQPETVTIRACANDDCSELFTDPVNATLSPTNGWQGGNVVSLTGGLGQASLQNTTAGDVTLDVIGSQPSARPQSVTLCEEAGSAPSAANCVLTFVDSGLAFDVPDMMSHREEQNIQVRAVRRDNQTDQCVPAFENVERTVGFWSTYIDPDAAGRPVSRPVSVDGTDISGSASSPTPLSLTFGAGGIAEIDVRYPDAGQMQLDALYEGSAANSDAGLTMPGADNFASRPVGLCVTTAGECAAADASCPTFVKAGASFDLSVTAAGWQSDTDIDFCAGNPTTPNFSMADIELTSELVAPSAGVPGTFAPATYDHLPAADATTVVPSTISEVGVFRFTAKPSPGGYFGQTVPEAKSQPAGRFYPDRFIVAVDPGELLAECVGPPSFNYIGQGFSWLMAPSATIEPVSVTGARTRNYADPAFTDPGDQAFQKLAPAGVTRTMPASDTLALNANGDPLAVTVSANSGTLAPIAPGLLEYTYSAGDTISYDKVIDARVALVADPALEFVINSIVDSDSVAGADAPYSISPVMNFSIRYGRLALENAYGPETMDLVVPFEAQIWNGSRFERHTDDNCWAYNTADAVVTDTPPSTSVEAKTGTLANGGPASGAELLLTAPGEGNTGSVQVRYPVPLYWQDDFDGDGSLEDPTATGTFGVYRGNDRVIYWRER